MAELAPSLDRVVVIGNAKGGVGKTTVTISLAGALHADGVRVLVADLDRQGDATRDLGIEDDAGDDLAAALLRRGRPTPLTARQARPGLDVLAGGQALADVASALLSRGDRSIQGVWATGLADLADGYDVVLIDCPPGDPAMTEMALAAARFAVIPTRSDDRSLDGMIGLLARAKAAQVFNPALQLLGAVLFAVNPSATRMKADTLADMADDLNGRVFDTTIRYAEGIAKDTRSRGLLLHELTSVVADANAEALARLRSGQRGGGRTTYGRDVAPLAAEYRALASELLQKMSAALFPAAVTA